MITQLVPASVEGFDTKLVLTKQGEYKVSGEAAAAYGKITVGLVEYTGDQGIGRVTLKNGANTVKGFKSGVRINTTINFAECTLEEILLMAAKNLTTGFSDKEKAADDFPDMLSVRERLDRERATSNPAEAKAKAAAKATQDFAATLAAIAPEQIPVALGEFTAAGTDKDAQAAWFTKWQAK